MGKNKRMRTHRLSRRFPDHSSRIRHRNALTEKVWEDAVQGLGKSNTNQMIEESSHVKFDEVVTTNVGGGGG